jgi:hypothetical protein
MEKAYLITIERIYEPRQIMMINSFMGWLLRVNYLLGISKRSVRKSIPK